MIRMMKFAATLVLMLGVAGCPRAEQPAIVTYSIMPVEKGTVLFDLQPDDLDENGELEFWIHPNAAGKLTCEADVSTVVIAGADPGIERVNRAVRDLAEQARCTHDQDISYFIPKVTYISADAVSISMEITDYGRGANGSCHTRNKYLNFDLASGRQYRLPDILRSDAFPRIRQDILAHFRKDSEIPLDLLTDLLDRDFWAMGVFIKDHKLYVDMGNYLKSCVDGPFFPVEIDPSYIDQTRPPYWLNEALGMARRK